VDAKLICDTDGRERAWLRLRVDVRRQDGQRKARKFYG
jgi:hypothetical protein